MCSACPTTTVRLSARGGRAGAAIQFLTNNSTICSRFRPLALASASAPPQNERDQLNQAAGATSQPLTLPLDSLS